MGKVNVMLTSLMVRWRKEWGSVLMMFVFFIGYLCSPFLTWAAPLNDIRKEQMTFEKEFIQKALTGKLDCSREISQREPEFIERKSQISKVYDVHYWRSFGTQQCFRALLKAKAFDNALQFIESAKPGYLDMWWSLALEDAVEASVYATDGKCKAGERYEGKESDKLMEALLRGRDLSVHPPGRRGEIEGVLIRLSNLLDYPACMNREKLIGWLNRFLDLGLEASFWWEEPMVVGGLTTFSGIMRLNDVDLVNRILSGGLKQERKYWVYLFARAPSLEMVKLLEQRFKLQKSEYKKVLQIINAEKKFPEAIRKYGAGMAPEEVVVYFNNYAQ